jgi:hypothetical protein
MTFFDSGLVNFIKLLIIVGLISMLYMLMMQKIKEQNHKISSLLSLVTTMANEITILKNEPKIDKPEAVESNTERNEISDDSDYESDSDSDDSIDLEEIDLVKGDKITMTEMDFEENVIEELFDELEELIETPELEKIAPLEVTELTKQSNEPNVKKMNMQQLIDLAVSKNMKTYSEANKMKKKDLLQLFE